MQTMGGAMYILSPRCAHALQQSHSDHSGLGVVGYITLRFAAQLYMISHCYIPPPPQVTDGAATLNRRLSSYLQSVGSTSSPQYYILSALSRWITHMRKKDARILVGGDFNMDPDTSRGTPLQDWMSSLVLRSALKHVHPSETFPTHMLNGLPRTCIDHILVDDLSTYDLCAAGVVYQPLAVALSDHSPIFAGLRCAGISHSQRSLPPPPPPMRLELPHRNHQLVQQYQDSLETWITAHRSSWQVDDPTQAAAFLGALMGATAQTVTHITAPIQRLRKRLGKRSSFKDGYSPIFCTLKEALLLILQLQKDLYQSRRKCTSRSADLAPLQRFASTSIKWQRNHPLHCCTEAFLPLLTRAHDILASLRNSPFYTLMIIKSLHQLRSMMHGRLRTDWRIQQSERVANMELLRVERHFKRMFRSIGIKPRVSMSLDTLATTDGILREPIAIHNALSMHFEDWYRAPAQQHEFAKRLMDNIWIEQLLAGTAVIDSSLPASFRQAEFLEACRSRITPVQQVAIESAIGAPLLWDEYMSEIHLLAYGKAPGPSGVTASMIKAWPLEVHEAVFHALGTLWNQRSVPQWWLHSLLHPIPKKGSPTLDNLRPLGLYEILRKLQAAIIIKRAYRQWESHGILHPHQHAYRRGMGTGTAILRLLNLLEDASESGQPLLLTAWDIKRAFDSIPHSFIRLALLRLGTPSDVTEWFLYMLQHNVVTVQSPYALTQQRSFTCLDPATFDNDAHTLLNAASFHQQQGIGQGDTSSALIWLAVYDILLCMLDVPVASDSGHFLARGPVNYSYAAGSIAYADDLCSPAGTHALSQHQANLVSTFCAATTLTIATPKVLAFAVNVSDPTPLTLYDWQWNAHPIEYATHGIIMTYLGHVTAHQSGDAAAHDTALEILRSSALALRHRLASATCKLDVICMQLYPKILYAASKACWPLHAYRDLDRTLAPLLTASHRLMPTTAHDTLFFPKSHCGTGLNKISDLAQTQKWGELRRALHGTGEVRWAAHGLLERALRQLEYVAGSSQLRSTPLYNHQHLKCYAGSLLQWGAEVGCCLTVTPSTPHLDTDTPITPYLDPHKDAELLRILQDRDVTVQGELCVTTRDDHIRWCNDTFTTQLRKALAEHAIPLPAHDSLHMHAGQIYHLWPLDQYVELHSCLLDVIVPHIIARFWTADSTGTHIFIAAGDDSYLSIVPYADLAQQQWQRLSTTSCRRLPTQIARRRILVSSPCHPILPQRSSSRELPAELVSFAQAICNAQASLNQSYSLFTDGSYSLSGLPTTAILFSESERRHYSNVSAAIVAIGPPEIWQKCPVFVLAITTDSTSLPGASSYTAELLALTGAQHIRMHVSSLSHLHELYIHSDCKAAIATLTAVCTPFARKRQQGATHVITDSLVNCGECSVEWTRGHPERRNPDSATWSFCDWGIHLADVAASSSSQPTFPAHSDVQHFSMPHTALLNALLPPAAWHWTLTPSMQPLLCSPLELHQQLRVQEYLCKRDAIWHTSDAQRWTHTSLPFAARSWKLLGKPARTFGSTILRHCLDKCWHGRNRAKGERDEAKAAAARACLECGQADDQMHFLLHCPQQDTYALRQAADEELQQCADEFMQHSTIAAEPLIRRLILFILHASACAEYPHIDRIWLGTWNPNVLADCLAFGMLPSYSPPTELPYVLITLFDKVAARMLRILHKNFLLIRATAQARQRSTLIHPHKTEHPASLTSSASTPPQIRQQRLTALWKVAAPKTTVYADPAVPVSHHQQRITSFLAPVQPPTLVATPSPLLSATPTPVATAEPTASPLAAVPSTRRNSSRRKTQRQAAGASIHHYFQAISKERRTFVPHAATNPANSTPDHDPDKE